MISRKYLLLLGIAQVISVPIVLGQDCGNFLFRVNYWVAVWNMEFSFELRDGCQEDQLLLTYRDFQDSYSDTIQLDELIIENLAKSIERINIGKLNSLENPYLNDGVFVEYTYISRQSNLIRKRLHLPVINKLDYLKMEEEFYLLKLVNEISEKYLRDEENVLFQKCVKAHLINR